MPRRSRIAVCRVLGLTFEVHRPTECVALMVAADRLRWIG
jgi:hypothetical protein